MNFFKLCKILADHNRSAYSGPRNATCWHGQLSVHRKIVAIHGHEYDALDYDMDTNGDVREETAMAWHQYPL